MTSADSAQRFRVFTRKDLSSIPQLQGMAESEITAMKAVSAVLPFRVNQYVIDELIRWSDVPNDPIYQLTFPQQGLLSPVDFSRMVELVATDAPTDAVNAAAREIRSRLNPHPSGQAQLNVPTLGETAISGVQHKYRETVLFFPSAGQTCHAYCTYCFRWAQFVETEEEKFASRESEGLVRYLRAHPEVTNVLITGGDPMVMRTKVLRRFVEPLLSPSLAHIESIRFGTKALSYWPYRFTTDEDADDLMRLFEEVVAAGKHLAFMGHVSHYRELAGTAAQDAVRRVLGTGAVIRSQSPLIRHVNDAAEIWSRMWRKQSRLGIVPYYMFVERDTGANRYFEVPLAQALSIYNDAYRQVSGLCRTVRGPSMSATPGKVLLEGVAKVRGEKVFVLKFIQGRDPDWVGRPFFAKFDDEATWLDQLEPAFGESEFFFEADFASVSRGAVGSRRDLHILQSPDLQASSFS